MRLATVFWACFLLFGGIGLPRGGILPGPPSAIAKEGPATKRPARPALGIGAAPGNARGPGGFVPRGSLRNFYAAAGGRLWYYMNNYYWAPQTAKAEDLWLKAEVVEEFQELRRWPDGRAVPSPRKKRTVEYWQIGPTRRTVRVDNHKDFCLLSDAYTAGAIVVQVTLTLGHLQVRKEKDEWVRPRDTYVLQWRDYSGGGGIGEDRARFEALPREAVTVWAYRVPWDTHPQRLTRSNWQRLELPAWTLVARRPPPPSRRQAPVVTPR